MNILYYLDWFPKLSQSFILNEIYYLRQRGHNVAIFSINEPDQSITHEEVAELDLEVGYADPPRVRNILGTLSSMRLLSPSIIGGIKYLAPPRELLSPLYLSEQCLRFIDTLDWCPDIIHTHFARANKLGAAHAAAYHDIPCTLTTHAYDLYSPPSPRALRLVCSRVDRVVTISNYNKSYLQKQLSVDTLVDVIRVGIQPKKFEPGGASRSNRLLTVARLVEKKGIEYAIDAVAEIQSEHPDLEYHIVGSGDRKQELRSQVEQRGLTGTVSFLGSVSDERLITEFDEATAFLLPCVIADDGDRDGIPVVLMEAMAMQTPPVSTEISGIPELIDHHENGLLVKPRRVEELATAIRELLESESLQDRVGVAARHTVETTYNAERTTQELESLFRNELRANSSQ